MDVVKDVFDGFFLVFPPFAFAKGLLNMVTMTTMARLFAPYGVHLYTHPLALNSYKSGSNVELGALFSKKKTCANLKPSCKRHSIRLFFEHQFGT